MISLVNSTKHLERINANLSQTLPKIRRKGTFPNSFYKISIWSYPDTKSDKDMIRKGNYRPISLMNIDAKNLNNILANQNQQYTTV